jgi:hypothetical protein
MGFEPQIRQIIGETDMNPERCFSCWSCWIYDSFDYPTSRFLELPINPKSKMSAQLVADFPGKIFCLKPHVFNSKIDKNIFKIFYPKSEKKKLYFFYKKFLNFAFHKRIRLEIVGGVQWAKNVF